MDKKTLWEKCIEFHGHACGGLAIGFQAAIYAARLLNIEFSKDEDVVCVSENDACGVDAIQRVLGCSAGKGNLLFRLRGKQAFSIFDRKSGKAVRLVLKADAKDTKRGGSLDDFLARDPSELFEVKSPNFALPEPAEIFQSAPCARCGERTAEPFLRLENGQKLCLDCASEYSRFMR